MKTVKQKILIAVMWLLVAVVMVLIFKFSAQNSVESADTSGGFMALIEKLFGIEVTQFIVRKLAHATEFCGLGLVTFWAMYVTFDKIRPFWTFLISVLYSISDEIHQIFVPGRACRVFDVFVDTCGISVGIIFCVGIYLLILKHFNKKIENK